MEWRTLTGLIICHCTFRCVESRVAHVKIRAIVEEIFEAFSCLLVPSWRQYQVQKSTIFFVQIRNRRPDVSSRIWIFEQQRSKLCPLITIMWNPRATLCSAISKTRLSIFPSIFWAAPIIFQQIPEILSLLPKKVRSGFCCLQSESPN